MAFKTMTQYNEDKYGGLFILRDDNDYADVIFLYPSIEDVLVASAHYIKSQDYTGYVHCTGNGCPACAKGLRTQDKLFIPLYNLTTGQVEFWDRNIRFEAVLSSSVFSKVPNPSEYVFRIVRHGAYRDVNTTYAINLLGKNTMYSYQELLNKFNISFPEYYETICKSVTNMELDSMLLDNHTNTSYESSNVPEYSPIPRGAKAYNGTTSTNTSQVENIPSPDTVDVPDVPAIDVDVPSVPDIADLEASDDLPAAFDESVDSVQF